MGLVSSYLIQIFNAGVMNEPLLSGFEQVTRPGMLRLRFLTCFKAVPPKIYILC